MILWWGIVKVMAVAKGIFSMEILKFILLLGFKKNSYDYGAETSIGCHFHCLYTCSVKPPADGLVWISNLFGVRLFYMPRVVGPGVPCRDNEAIVDV